MLVINKGSFLKRDETTLTKLSMEEARVYIKSPCKEVIFEVVEVLVDDVLFSITLCEDPSLLKEYTVQRKYSDDVLE